MNKSIKNWIVSIFSRNHDTRKPRNSWKFLSRPLYESCEVFTYASLHTPLRARILPSSYEFSRRIHGHGRRGRKVVFRFVVSFVMSRVQERRDRQWVSLRDKIFVIVKFQFQFCAILTQLLHILLMKNRLIHQRTLKLWYKIKYLKHITFYSAYHVFILQFIL